MFILCVQAQAQQQASAPLPVRAGVVQCGNYDDLPLACERDARCCVLKDRFYFAPVVADLPAEATISGLDTHTVLVPSDGSDYFFE